MIPTKKMTLHVPVSVSKIVDDMHEALEIGSTMVHLHARKMKCWGILDKPTDRTLMTYKYMTSNAVTGKRNVSKIVQLLVGQR